MQQWQIDEGMTPEQALAYDQELELPATQCEDFPCCGHERGDCNGNLHPSDDDIKARVYAQLSDPSYDPYYDQENY